MRQALRRAVPMVMAVVILLPAQWAGATERSVSIENFAFHPQLVGGPLGTSVTWTNDDSIFHTTTADSSLPNGQPGIEVWDSGNLGSGDTFTFAFPWAATFTYHCNRHPGRAGRVRIPVKVVDLSDQDGPKYRIRWAKADPPENLSFDVQIKRPGQGQVFEDWRPLTTKRSAIFVPKGPGTYGFRSRLVLPGAGVIQGSTFRSPPRFVTVA